jgi:outer membrane autotransporter protein
MLYSTSAVAASGLCSTVNGNSYSQLSLTGQGNTGDSYSFTAQNLSGSSVNIGIAYDNGDGTPYITSGGASGEALANGASKVFTFTATTTDSNAKLILNDPSGSANMTFAVTCTAQSSGSNASNETTSKDVISAVSRSQTAVIQQNIGARASAVTGGGAGGATGPAGGTVDDDTTNLMGNLPGPFSDNNRPHSNSAGITNGDDALRRMAMMGSFDSSTSAGLGALGLGPTDQGTTGGTSGIDGRTAFSTPSLFTVWGHGSFTSIENDYVSDTTDNRYDGDVWGYNIGLDYSFAPALTAGVSLGYIDSSLSTSSNDGTYQEKGWVVSPYAIYRPIESLTLVGEFGFGQGGIDVTRNNGAVTGDTDSDLWYGALSASYTIRPDANLPFSLTPSAAVIAAGKTVDGYRESNGTVVETTRSNTRQIKPSIEAAYDFAPTNSLTVTPFVETGLIYDFTDEINNDKTAFNIGGGVRMSDAVTGLNAALEGNYLAGRSDYAEYTIGGTVTYGFEVFDNEGRNMGIVSPFFASNLNEYGNQHIRTGFDFESGVMTSQVVLSHMMSVANDDDDTDRSSIKLNISMPF